MLSSTPCNYSSFITEHTASAANTATRVTERANVWVYVSGVVVALSAVLGAALV
jgi:cytochrome c-type biogenesis protein CcmH/NrfG